MIELRAEPNTPWSGLRGSLAAAARATEDGVPQAVATALAEAAVRLQETAETAGAAAVLEAERETVAALREEALNLAAAGHAAEAAALVAAAGELWAEALSPAGRARLLGIAGRVARAAARNSAAESLLARAWEELCAAGAQEPAAAVLLDRVSLLAAAGRAAAAADLLRQGLARLRAEALRPGTRAALDLAAIALAKPDPPLGLIEELAVYLRGAPEV
jgi:hypothetical protein